MERVSTSFIDSVMSSASSILSLNYLANELVEACSGKATICSLIKIMYCLLQKSIAVAFVILSGSEPPQGCDLVRPIAQ